ncbi:TPA_asm: restriction endonuclease subunit S [Listeria monocytogenes]|nr:restriction endonuclease subunit S [Listeria monocytogenes]
MNKKVPKRRFQEFNNAVAWEQRKLLEHIEKVLDFRGKSPTKFGMEWLDKGYLVLSALNVKAGYIDKSVEAKFGSQELFDKWMGEQRLRKGDVVFTTEAPLGNVAQIPDNNGYILNQRAVAFKTFPDIMDNDFLAQYLRSPFFQHNLNMNASGGTAKGIGMKEFAKLSSYLPKDVKEQKKIGALLKTIDNIIALHQRKLEKIKALKTAYLSEMFPAEGETKPKRRFGGFTDDWEQRKLEDILDVRSGRDYKHLDSGDIPVYGTGGYMLSVGEALSYEEDAIGIGRKGTIDKPYILNAPFWTVDTLFYTVPKRDSDLNFIHSIFQKINWKSKDESTGVPSLSKTTINAVSVFTPSCSEQKEIGTFFNKLDDTIALHQRKLQKLQNIKKAYLNEMFI